MSQESTPTVGDSRQAMTTASAPVSSVPVFDDKAGIRETLDFSDARWMRGGDPEAGDGDQPEPGEHVEIAFVESETGDSYVGMRNSAQPEGPILVFTPAEWDAFVEGAKDGEFDMP